MPTCLTVVIGAALLVVVALWALAKGGRAMAAYDPTDAEEDDDDL